MTTRMTPGGIVFDESTVTPVDDVTRLWVPSHVQDGTGVTLVVLAHGWGGDNNHINSPELLPFAYGCMERGWVAACPDLGGDSWANDQAMTDLANLYAWAAGRWNVQRVVLHGTSAGAWTVAAAHATAAMPDLAAIVTIDGVLAPQKFYNRYAGSKTSMDAAWGTTEITGFAAAIAGRDPEYDPVALWRGVPYFTAASYSDTTVSRTHHTDMFVARMSDPEHDVTFTATTGGHVVAANFLNPQALAWVDTHAPPYSGGSPGEPPGPGVGSSNLRRTDGTPVMVRSTAGDVVSLSPA